MVKQVAEREIADLKLGEKKYTTPSAMWIHPNGLYLIAHELIEDVPSDKATMSVAKTEDGIVVGIGQCSNTTRVDWGCALAKTGRDPIKVDVLIWGDRTSGIKAEGEKAIQLPAQHLTRGKKDLELGEFGYIAYWGMYKGLDGEMYLHGPSGLSHYGGNCVMRVARTEEGIVVDVRECEDYSSESWVKPQAHTYKWPVKVDVLIGMDRFLTN